MEFLPFDIDTVYFIKPLNPHREGSCVPVRVFQWLLKMTPALEISEKERRYSGLSGTEESGVIKSRKKEGDDASRGRLRAGEVFKERIAQEKEVRKKILLIQKLKNGDHERQESLVKRIGSVKERNERAKKNHLYRMNLIKKIEKSKKKR